MRKKIFHMNKHPNKELEVGIVDAVGVLLLTSWFRRQFSVGRSLVTLFALFTLFTLFVLVLLSTVSLLS